MQCFQISENGEEKPMSSGPKANFGCSWSGISTIKISYGNECSMHIIDPAHYILGGSVRKAMYPLILMTMNMYNTSSNDALTAALLRRHDTWVVIKYPSF